MKKNKSKKKSNRKPRKHPKKRRFKLQVLTKQKAFKRNQVKMISNRLKKQEELLKNKTRQIPILSTRTSSSYSAVDLQKQFSLRHRWSTKSLTPSKHTSIRIS